jgi:hypothetical protein
MAIVDDDHRFNPKFRAIEPVQRTQIGRGIDQAHSGARARRSSPMMLAAGARLSVQRLGGNKSIWIAPN